MNRLLLLPALGLLLNACGTTPDPVEAGASWTSLMEASSWRGYR